MIRRPTRLVLAFLSSAAATVAQETAHAPAFVPDLCAVELPADDVAATAAFWRDALAWRLERDVAPEFAVLAQGAMRLLVRQSRAPKPPPGAPWLSLNVRVPDLAAAVDAVRRAGGVVDDPTPQPFALGRTVAARDPSGNVVHLLVLANGATVDAPRLFNVGWHVRDLAATETFWVGLGLHVASRDFLPDTLPMQRHGAAPLVFHGGHGAAALPNDTRRPVLHFGVPALAPAVAALTAAQRAPQRRHAVGGPLGRSVRLRDPDGLAIAIVERSAAQAWFERLCGLAGEWDATSTNGWGHRVRYQLIAGGSVLVEHDPQGSTASSMLTCIAMDGDRLLLTHFCHAGNAPRLLADVEHATADELTFRFLDGGNLAARDVGHMDELTVRFAGKDRFTSTWSWYQDGVSKPFESITHTRVPR